MWQTKYASTVPKNLGVGVDFGHTVKAISSPGVRSVFSDGFFFQRNNLLDFETKSVNKFQNGSTFFQLGTIHHLR